MNATFIISTGEAPGQNRLEVVAEKGLVTVEDGATLDDYLSFDTTTNPGSTIITIDFDGAGAGTDT